MLKKYLTPIQYVSITFLLFFYFSLCISPSFATEPIPANISQNSISLPNSFDFFIDRDGNLSVEDIQKQAIQDSFNPLNIHELPKESGTVWLRFTLAERDSYTAPDALLLDLGSGLPPTPTLYVPRYNALIDITEWQKYPPTQQSIFLMPEARSTPLTAYVRLDGMPNPWFAPTLRTPQDAATALERMASPAIVIALGVVMLLSLLRGLTERGQWRIWASLYTAVVLFHAIWGIPPTPKGFIELKDMPAAVTPGLALMLLPHVARHLMRSNIYSRIIDLQYMLLTLPGVAIALLPLIPGYAWTVSYMALWPALTILLVPTTLGAWLSGLPGARRFLMGALLPPAGVAIALVGLQEPHFLPLSILQTLPLWGIALSTLIIAGTTAPQEYSKDKAQEKDTKTAANNKNTDVHDFHADELSLDDPNLKLITIDEAQSTKQDAVNDEETSCVTLEEHLRWPVDQLLRDVVALESCALPPLVREHVSSLSTVAREISNTLSAPVNERSSAQSMSHMNGDIFELQGLLRQAHDSVSALADSKNIALSWFMPPHLSQSYKGDAVHLLFVLRLLLESSVRATNRGAVQLAVRRVPESINPGHLLFTVTDTGTGKPPQERSVSALARAWELAASCHGFLGVESNAYGASISFTLHCEVTTQDMLNKSQRTKDSTYPSVMIISDNDADRQLWSFFLEKLPYSIIEARNKKETLELYAKQEAKLLIFDARIQLHKLQEIINHVHKYGEKNNLDAALCLALSPDNTENQTLKEIGLPNILTMPITRSNLRNIVSELLGHEPMEELSPTVNAENNSEEHIIDTGLPIIDMPESKEDEEAQETLKSNETPLSMEPVVEPIQDPEPMSTLEAELSSQSEFEHNFTEKDLAGQTSNPTLEPESMLEPEIMATQNVEPEPMPETTPKVEVIQNDNEEYVEKIQDFEPLAFDQTTEHNLVQAQSQETLLEPETMPEPDTELPAEPKKDSVVAEPKSTSITISSSAPKAKTKTKSEKTIIAKPTVKIEKNLKPAPTSMVDKETKSTQESKPEATAKHMQPAPKILNKPKIRVTHVADQTKPKPEEDNLKSMPPLNMHADTPQTEPATSGHGSSLSDGILLPLIDSLSTTSQEMNAEQLSNIAPETPVKDKTNAAYLTSLIDSSPSKLEAKPEKKSPLKKAMTIVNKIAKPVMKQNTLADSHTPKPHAAGNSGEWVGEPIPVQSNNTTDSSSPVNANQQMQPSQIEESLETQEQPAQVNMPTQQEVVFQEQVIVGEPFVSEQPMSPKQPAYTPKHVEQQDNMEHIEQVGEPRPVDLSAKIDQKLEDATKSRRRVVPPPPLPNSASADPLQELLQNIDTSLNEAKDCFASANTEGVAVAVSSLIQHAETFGLRSLARLARPVEAAAKASDMDALHDLFPELEIGVERNRIALKM